MKMNTMHTTYNTSVFIPAFVIDIDGLSSCIYALCIFKCLTVVPCVD